MRLFGKKELDSNEGRSEKTYKEYYNKKLEQLSNSQEAFTSSLNQMQQVSKKLEVIMKDYESKEHDQKLSNANLALDLQYIKEQGDCLSESLNKEVITAFREMKQQLVQTYTIAQDLKQKSEEIVTGQDKLWKKLKGRHALQVIQFILEVFLVGGVLTIVLKLFEII